MKNTILVTEVKQVQGFINENSIYAYNANRYNQSKHLISRSYEPIALFVKGIDENGNEIKFYSPTVILTVTVGFIGGIDMDKNSWFEQIMGEIISAKGLPMFDGGDTPNVAIKQKSEIKPKINVGDKINISYSINQNGKINRVKYAKL